MGEQSLEQLCFVFSADELVAGVNPWIPSQNLMERPVAETGF